MLVIQHEVRVRLEHSQVSQMIGNSLCSHPALFMSDLGGILVMKEYERINLLAKVVVPSKRKADTTNAYRSAAIGGTARLRDATTRTLKLSELTLTLCERQAVHLTNHGDDKQAIQSNWGGHVEGSDREDCAYAALLMLASGPHKCCSSLLILSIVQKERGAILHDVRCTCSAANPRLRGLW